MTIVQAVNTFNTLVAIWSLGMIIRYFFFIRPSHKRLDRCYEQCQADLTMFDEASKERGELLARMHLLPKDKFDQQWDEMTARVAVAQLVSDASLKKYRTEYDKVMNVKPEKTK